MHTAHTCNQGCEWPPSRETGAATPGTGVDAFPCIPGIAAEVGAPQYSIPMFKFVGGPAAGIGMIGTVWLTGVTFRGALAESPFSEFYKTIKHSHSVKSHE